MAEVKQYKGPPEKESIHMKVWLAVSLLLLSLVVGFVSLMLGQLNLEIVGLCVWFLAAMLFIWSLLRLSYSLRPPAFRGRGQSRRQGARVKTAFPGYWPDTYRGAESLSSGIYNKGNWDENEDLPDDRSLGE